MPISLTNPQKQRINSKVTVLASLSIAVTIASSLKFFVQHSFTAELDTTQALIEVGGSLAATMATMYIHRIAPRRRLRYPAITKFVLGYALIVAPLSIFSWNPAFSWVRAGLFLASVVNLTVAVSRIGVWCAARAAAWTVFIITLAGVLVAIALPSQYPLFRTEYADRAIRWRIWLFNTHPISVADLCAIGFLLTVLVGGKAKWLRCVILFAVAFGTVSRASLAGLIVASALAFGLALKVWQRTLMAALVTLLLAVVSLSHALTGALLDKFTTSVAGVTDLDRLVADTQSNDNLTGRLPLWTALIDNVGYEALRGFGVDGARVYIKALGGWTTHTHNSYLEVLHSGGLAGFVVFTAGVMVSAMKGVRALSHRTTAALGATVVYTLIAAMMGPILTQPLHLLTMMLWTGPEAGPTPLAGTVLGRKCAAGTAKMLSPPGVRIRAKRLTAPDTSGSKG